VNRVLALPQSIPVSDATKAAMVTPTSVNFERKWRDGRRQMGGGNVYNMEGLMGVDTSDVRKTILFLMEGHPTKMECAAMIIIDKGPNKGLLFEPNTGSNLGHPVGFLFCPEFLPPPIHPTTRWLDYKSSHTMVPSHSGFFFFFTTITFKDLVYGQSSSHW